MSGVIGTGGSKSGLVGISIGDSASARLNAAFTGASGDADLTTWTFMNNDNPSLYSIGTYGITISTSGTYMINMNLFTEGRSETTRSYMTLLATGGASSTWEGQNFQTLDDGGVDGDSGRQTVMMSKPLPLVGGNTYGVRSHQVTGTRNIPANSYSSISLTLLRIG